MKKIGIYLGIGVILIGLSIVYYSFNPLSSPLFPKCPFFVLTGWKCPGCGSQRAIHALLHGDVITACKNNALLVLSLPLIFILLYAECMRKKHPKLYTQVHRPVWILIYFLIVIAWWVGRNWIG